MLQFKEQVKYFDKNVPGMSQMGMQFMTAGTTEELKRQIVDLTFERACLTDRCRPRRKPWARCGEAKARLGLIMQEVCRPGRRGADRMAAVTKETAGLQGAGGGGADIEAQLAPDRQELRRRHETPFERLQHLPALPKAVGGGSTN